MPELPEVETTRAGIAPHIEQAVIKDVIIRERRLRWPIPRQLRATLLGQRIGSVTRRGKYLLLSTPKGCLIIHLGMSGNLRVLPVATAVEPHDHVDILFDNGKLLRFHDPRRFGAILWTDKAPEQNDLLASLGPEPLSEAFSAKLLYQRSRNKRQTIKAFIMDSKVVVGVGNIYASEALFLAGIHPKRAAGKISLQRYVTLTESIKQVLTAAIEQGGTTLRDFLKSDGKPGYFQQQLNVYGREGEACPQCGSPILRQVIGQRASYYCPQCQH